MRFRLTFRALTFAGIGVAAAASLHGAQTGPSRPAPQALHLPFDALGSSLHGHGWLGPGVVGQGLQLDGIAAHLRVPSAEIPALGHSFTVEGWVALGAYPFNDAPLLQQQEGESAGWFLGVGDRGQIRFDAVTASRRLSIESVRRLGLREWAYVVGVFQEGRGITLYVDGAEAGHADGDAAFVQAARSDLWVGRNAYELHQTAAVGAGRQQSTRIFLDGMLDELRVTPSAATASTIAEAYSRLAPRTPPAIDPRHLPSLPPGPSAFGASYTTLRYYKGWDDVWRVGDAADVVVRFDRAPYWMAFWRGTSYIPHWVTETGVWYDNEFTETFPPGMVGSAEPMSDKQCRYSQVRILESHDARVVVHWRYAPLGVGYVPAYPDPETDWADWTDEVHTIYPDGVGVRKIVVHSSKPDADREWHESIVVMGPGTTPNDALERTGLTIANSRGESVDVSWEHSTPPLYPAQPPGSGIQIIHTRSRFQPFTIARAQDDPSFDVYAGEVRRDISIYPWWNHWPTAFEPSNGRYALAADRASHSSLSHLHWKPIETSADRVVKIHLEGLSDAGVPGLAALARSWESPAQLGIESAGYGGGQYDPGERAWIVQATGANRGPLAMTLQATPASPVENVALVVTGWGSADATLLVDGRPVARGDRFRVGHRQRVAGADLIVFVTLRASSPTSVVLGRP
jgi:concanavalin A-like lectin/glucanase superfamily protein